MRTCAEPGCERKAECKGLCATHYQKFRRSKLAAANPPAPPVVPVGLMTPDEVARRLNIKPRTLFEYLRNGNIVGIKIGGAIRGRWMISYEAYNAFVREKEQQHLQAIARMRAVG